LFTVEVTGLEQLARILSKLHTVRDVLDVRREAPSMRSVVEKK
jgi:(p)ppGpp synthase/HD superfamily hydrolase